MAFIRKKPSGMHEVCYRDPSGRSRGKSFRRKTDARRFAAEIETDIHRGRWVEPSLGRVTFVDYVEGYLDGISHLRPGTQLKVEGHVRNYVLPAFGDKSMGLIRTTDVRAWVSGMVASNLSPATVSAIFRTLAKIMTTAERDGVITKSPCVGVDLPKSETHEEMRFFTPEEIEQLAEAIGIRYRALIFTAAYTGMRWGELIALKRDRLHLLKRTVDVVESLAEVNGRFYLQTTKTRARRTIVLPRFLCEMLSEHIGRYPSDEGYVFTGSRGKPLRHTFYARYFKPALAKAGLDQKARLHDLRHSCAGLLISQGAHPKEIADHLGHSTVRLSLDRYGHLFPQLTERLRQGLDAAYRDGKTARDAVYALSEVSTLRPE
jgi:integrase